MDRGRSYRKDRANEPAFGCGEQGATGACCEIACIEELA